MVKKVIQVPVDQGLLGALDRMSRRQNRARAELIREACQAYLAGLESEEMDRLYQEGYERLPEELRLGEMQAALAAEILPEESW
ncbi:MAG: ribbon-helix-helix protein, CopG family [Dehalococcoidia bacterium]|nr:ribbon-helix-helix protein, CopG family [Dehalococcoidia bacterium]